MTEATSILELAMRVLAGRVAVLIALGMAFGLFCWAIWLGTVLGLATAATFSLMVFLPILLKEHTRGHDQAS